MIFLGATKLDAVLFDLDGTLAQTHIDFGLMRSEMTRMAGMAGVPAAALAGKEILEMAAAATDFVGANAGSRLRGEMWLKLEEIERDGCKGATPIPGAPELLTRLEDSAVKVGVVTRNCRAVSEPLLQDLGLSCDVLLTRDDVARCKPDPAHLRDALAALGVPAERSAMVGDHWLDVQAGKKCGCAATIGVLGKRPPEWFDPCSPDYFSRDLMDAQNWFRA